MFLCLTWTSEFFLPSVRGTNSELQVKLSRGRWRWKRWCPGWEWRATSGRGNTTPDGGTSRKRWDKMFLCRLSCCAEMNSYLSGSDGALQRSFFHGQVGVGVGQPGQGGAVRMEMRLLIRRVEEPALCHHKHIVQSYLCSFVRFRKRHEGKKSHVLTFRP